MEILKKQYKENSHQKIEDIKEMQAKHADDLIQPRDEEGKINPKFVERFGTKNLNISSDDVERVAKFSQRLASQMDSRRRQSEGRRKYF